LLLLLTFFRPPAPLPPLPPLDTAKSMLFYVAPKFLRQMWLWKYDKKKYIFSSRIRLDVLFQICSSVVFHAQRLPLQM